MPDGHRATAEQAIGCAVLDMLAEDGTDSGLFTIALQDDRHFALELWPPISKKAIDVDGD